MPYISKEEREWISRGHPPVSVGQLNYCISTMISNFINEYGFNYSIANGVIGVLECAKLELYRRLVAPYEDEKKEIHGDVYKGEYR